MRGVDESKKESMAKERCIELFLSHFAEAQWINALLDAERDGKACCQVVDMNMLMRMNRFANFRSNSLLLMWRDRHWAWVHFSLHMSVIWNFSQSLTCQTPQNLHSLFYVFVKHIFWQIHYEHLAIGRKTNKTVNIFYTFPFDIRTP